MITSVSTPEETLQQVTERVWETIPPLWNQMRDNVRAIASESFGISVPEFRVLRHIRRGVRSVCDLALASQTSRPAISQCVDALVEKGLVIRCPSTRDRRRVELALTPSGNEMLDAIFRENHRWMREKLASLSPEEMDRVLQGLRVLASAFGG